MFDNVVLHFLLSKKIQEHSGIFEGTCWADERFLILPHPTVADYVARKAGDRDRWLRGMARLRERLFAGEIKQ